MHATTPETNLRPVSTTQAANFASGTAGVVDTGGKFASSSKVVCYTIQLSTLPLNSSVCTLAVL